MAKKTKKEPVEQEQQNSVTVESKNSTDGVQYKGTIKVQVKKGNRLISERSYHNLGGSPLFDFLSRSIIGDSTAQNYAPRYIELFYYQHEDGESPAANLGITSDSQLVSPAIAFNTSSVVQVVTNNVSNPAAYLHFIIPCANFNFPAGITAVNQAALYGSKYTGERSQTTYSAAFNFVDDDGKWDDLTITTANGDFNVFIEWTLSFSN